MSRDWVKLHTSMLGHVGTMRLSDWAFRVWIVLITMAGQADDDGRAGTLDDVAFYFRRDEADILAALAEMNGRAFVQDGAVYVRDWTEWQPRIDATAAKRQAEYRARQAEEAARNAAIAATVTESASHRDVTALRDNDRNAATRGREPVEPEEPPGTEEPSTVMGTMNDVVPPRRHRVAVPTKHQATFGAICEACQLDPVLMDSNTAANVGKLASEAEKAGVSPEAITSAGHRWRTDRFKGKSPADVGPPTVAQFRTWLGQCRAKANGNMIVGAY